MANVSVLGKKEWLSIEEATKKIGKSEKSIERLVKGGNLRKTVEVREGKRVRLYHAGDLDRIKVESIPASAVEPSRALVPSKPMELSLSEPIEMSLSPELTTIAGTFEKALEAWMAREAARDERKSIEKRSWLTWRQAVELSGIPMRALFDLSVEGKIIALKFGRSWRVSRKSLEAFEG